MHFHCRLRPFGSSSTNLAIKRELKPLASLLRVSKYVCLATQPILYEDPFVWFAQRDQGRQNHSIHYSYSFVYHVIRLLFASVPKDSYSGLLKAMREIEDAAELTEVNTSGQEDPTVVNDGSSSLPSTSQHWPIDYLSYIRHFITVHQRGESVLTDLAVYIEMPLCLKSYVEKHKLAETYAALALKIDMDWYHPNNPEEDLTTVDFLVAYRLVHGYLFPFIVISFPSSCRPSKK